MMNTRNLTPLLFAAALLAGSTHAKRAAASPGASTCDPNDALALAIDNADAVVEVTVTAYKHTRTKTGTRAWGGNNFDVVRHDYGGTYRIDKVFEGEVSEKSVKQQESCTNSNPPGYPGCHIPADIKPGAKAILFLTKGKAGWEIRYPQTMSYGPRCPCPADTAGTLKAHAELVTRDRAINGERDGNLGGTVRCTQATTNKSDGADPGSADPGSADPGIAGTDNTHASPPQPPAVVDTAATATDPKPPSEDPLLNQPQNLGKVTPRAKGAGCGCTTAPSPTPTGALLGLAMAAALGLRRRRKAERSPAYLRGAP